MSEKYLTEAFQELKILDEDIFDLNDQGIAQAQEFVSDDTSMDFEDVIDPLAQTEEDLRDSYIGKVILDCTICQSKIYKDAEEVILDETGELANIGEECPYCQSVDGFKVIGQVAPFKEAEEPEVTADAEVTVKTEEKPEEEKLEEDLNKVEIETEDQKIKIEAESKEVEETTESSDEMIAPITDETVAEFKEEKPEYSDVDIDEFEESDFDELGEGYLKRVYENVDSYKTTSGSTSDNKLKLEGIITFKSGKQVKTNFVFEAASINKLGKVKFTGLNEQFAKGKKTYTLVGTVNKGKLIAESLTYNYRAKDTETNESKRIYGKIHR